MKASTESATANLAAGKPSDGQAKGAHNCAATAQDPKKGTTMSKKKQEEQKKKEEARKAEEAKELRLAKERELLEEL